jgi:hypothetical protein
MKAKRIWGASTSVAAYMFCAATTSWIPQAAQAQSADQPTTSAPTTAAATSVDDTTVAKFVAAYTEVSAIQTQAADQLKATSDPQQAAQVKKDAESRALQAVQSKGLKPEEFNNIAQQMASDEKLRTRVAAKLNERTGGG